MHRYYTEQGLETAHVTDVSHTNVYDYCRLASCNPCLCKLVRLFEASGREGI